MTSFVMSKLFRVGRSQFLGIAAQVVATAPVILLSIYLAQTIGLGAVADFTVLIGLSSVIFTLSMIGLRSRLVLDRFRVFSEPAYYTLRIVATGLMALGILVFGMAFGAPAILTVAVMLMRVGDAALDLVLAIDQVRCDVHRQIYGYLQGGAVKLLLIVVFLAGSHFTGSIDPFVAFMLASASYALYAWRMFLKRCESDTWIDLRTGFAELGRLIRHSLAFAVAQILCAALTSAPRIALPTVSNDRDMAGAAAAALSVSTLVGMTFFAVWLRWIPRFGVEGIKRRTIVYFVIESSAALGIMAIAILLVGSPVMAVLYSIDAPFHLELAEQTLLASLAFFFFMTLANLFKPTKLPWAESMTYLGGLIAIGVALTLAPSITIPGLLAAASAGMAIAGVASFSVLRQLAERREVSEK